MLKKYKNYILIFIIVIFIELFIFNFNSLRIINENQFEVEKGNFILNDIESSNNSYIIKSNCASIEINNINIEIKDIYIDFIEEYFDKEINFKLYYTDESTKGYNSNHLVNTKDVTIYTGYGRSKYIPCNFSGNTEKLKIEFNDMENEIVNINNITINKQIPFSFENSLIRIVVMFLLISGVYYLKNDRRMNAIYEKENVDSFKLEFIIENIFIIIMIIILYLNIINDEMCLCMPNNDYYASSFINSLSKGKISLLEKPSQKLMQLENPYDFSQRVDGDILWDTVYYNGKYFIYFGILPALLVFLPLKILFNLQISSAIALVFFNLISILMSCKLIFIICRKWFKNIPYNLLCVLTMFFLFSNKILWITARPNFYEMIISATYFFVITGIYFIFKSNLITKDGELNHKYLCLGCIFLALAVACRPTSLFVSILILPDLITLFIKLLKNIKNDKNKFIKFLCCSLIPYIVVGILLMIYNYVRFRNPFEFGAKYQLTVTDMRYMGFSISRISIGIYSYLFNCPIITPIFPFVFSNNILPFYQGTYYNSSIGGGVFTVGILPFVIFLLPYLYKSIKEYNKDIIKFILICFGVGILLLAITSTIGGNIGRYAMDFAWLFNIDTIVIIMFIYEKVKDNECLKNIFIKVIISIVLLSAIMSFLLAILGEDELIYFLNKSKFYQLKYLFSFWM